MTAIPTISIGMFTGGYITKKFKFTLLGFAKFSFATSLVSFSFHLLNFALVCESKPVAGLTLTYDGFVSINCIMCKLCNVEDSIRKIRQIAILTKLSFN